MKKRYIHWKDKWGASFTSKSFTFALMISRLVTACVYLCFTLVAYLPMQESCASTASDEMTCCCGPSGSCSMNQPMDCCADEGEDLPLFDQVVPQTTEAPFTFTEQATQNYSFNFQLLEAHFQPITWQPPPDGQKVYIKLNRLVFYAWVFRLLWSYSSWTKNIKNEKGN